MSCATDIQTDTVRFWDRYARWHKQWIEHNDYHRPILDALAAIVEPGWRVLEIGAGNGVLSVPLAAAGCEVTAIEPSIAMRSLLFEEAFAKGIDSIDVEERRWEEIPVFELAGYDLILACNSLHLPEIGFAASLDKAMRADPANLFVVTEHVPGEAIRFAYPDHVMRCARSCVTDDSFAYHTIDEAFECQSCEKGRPLCPGEKMHLRRELSFRDNHFWLNATATVGMYWFERRDPSFQATMQ